MDSFGCGLTVNMSALAITLAFVMVLPTSVSPKLCSRGFYLESGVCKTCPPGQYTDNINRHYKCRHHRECKRLEYTLEEGNTTMNRVCACLSGKRMYYDDTKHGYDCKPCEDGLVSTPVIKNARDRGDTGCCPPGQKASRSDTGRLECMTMYSPYPAPTNPPNRSPSGGDPHLQGAAVAPKPSLAIGFSLCALIWLCRAF